MGNYTGHGLAASKNSRIHSLTGASIVRPERGSAPTITSAQLKHYGLNEDIAWQGGGITRVIVGVGDDYVRYMTSSNGFVRVHKTGRENFLHWVNRKKAKVKKGQGLKDYINKDGK